MFTGTRTVWVGLMVVLLAGAGSLAHGGIMTFNSPDFAQAAAYRTQWLNAIGITTPACLVDFESGFTSGQNIHNQPLFPGGLLIKDLGPGSPLVMIVQGAGTIGGSNPVGNFAFNHDETHNLLLDFTAQPVDYVGFRDIDQSGTLVTVTFFGGGTVQYNMDSTAASGNSAEFLGIFRNDMPRILSVEFNANGSAGWALDNIEYGPAGPAGDVPEPGSLGLGVVAAVCLLILRRRTG